MEVSEWKIFAPVFEQCRWLGQTIKNEGLCSVDISSNELRKHTALHRELRKERPVC